MIKRLLLLSLIVIGASLLATVNTADDGIGAPPYGEAEEEVPATNDFSRFSNWKRPPGPAKVALQVGHWKNEELPEELEKLIGNTGARGGGKWEWEVNHQIATLTSKSLREAGVSVEILPATVPPEYWADAFIAIHADGSTDRSKSGYKVAGPWRDLTNSGSTLVDLLEMQYEEATGLAKDTNITRNMRGYYAFSWWRYDHAIHPMTTAAIVETGFLTSPKDQKLLINKPEISAQGLAEGILEYLKIKQLL